MKLLKRLLPFAVVLLAALLLLKIPDIGPERYTDLASFFRTERSRQGFVGYTIAAVDAGSLLYVDAFGTDGRGLPLMPGTPMAIGSLSKSFTGLLALSLETDGRLDIDSPLGAYLPELSLKGYAKQTGDPSPLPSIRHFLSHSSGYSDRDFDDRHRGAGDLVKAASSLSGVSPRSAPGAEFHYLNAGYEALGLVLERITGRSYAELLRERIFAPLGMESSAAGGAAGEADVAEALPLGSSSFFGAVLPRNQELPPFYAPSGGIISTAPDMAKYLAYLVAPTKVKAKAGRLPLSPRALARLRDPLVPGINYSYGWWIGPEGSTLSHGGSLEGFSASASLWPDWGGALVILAPQNSMFQSLIALPALVEGARRIMVEGSTERPFPLNRVFILLAVMAAVHLAALAAQIGASLSWARNVRARSDASGSEGALRFARFRTLAGIALRLGLLAILPYLIELFFGRAMDWASIFSLEPALGGWVVAAVGFGLLRNVTRLSWLRGPRR